MEVVTRAAKVSTDGKTLDLTVDGVTYHLTKDALARLLSTDLTEHYVLNLLTHYLASGANLATASLADLAKLPISTSLTYKAIVP